MRTFIALELEPNLKEAMLKVIRELKNCTADIKWVKFSSMHLTLKFLGEIQSAICSDLKAEVKKACSEHAPFTLQFKGTGTFPSASPKPRIIWAGIKNSQSLNSLQQKIEHHLEQLGFPFEKRKYSPHLTLGRVKSYRNINMVLTKLHNFRDRSFGQMQVNQVVLFQSILKPSGAEYNRIFTVDLK